MSETIIIIGGEELVVSLARENGHLVVTDGERRDEIEILGVRGDEAELLINGRRRLVPFYLEGDSVHFHLEGETITATVEAKARAGRKRHKEHSMTAPMPGVVLEIFVGAGDVVSKGTPLLILEAMKMEHSISAPYDGVVEAVHCSKGELVQPGVDLISLKQNGEE